LTLLNLKILAGNFLYDISFDIVALYDNEILFNIILRRIIGWTNFWLNIVQQMVDMLLID